MQSTEEYLQKQHRVRERLYEFINQLISEENLTPEELTDAVGNVAKGINLLSSVAFLKIQNGGMR